jgi:hypothetical protein
MLKTLLTIVLIAIGIISLMLIPSKQPKAPMPWEVTIMNDGNPKVFDIHLGKTTLKEAQIVFRETGETAIFTNEAGATSIEAFFNSTNMGGLSAKIVLNLAIEEETVKTVLSRAVKGRIQPSGDRQFTLQDDDQQYLREAAITAITYIPSVRIEQEMITQRFGKESAIEKEGELTTLHYPNKGLTISLKPGEKSILQYQQVH